MPRWNEMSFRDRERYISRSGECQGAIKAGITSARSVNLYTRRGYGGIELDEFMTPPRGYRPPTIPKEKETESNNRDDSNDD